MIVSFKSLEEAKEKYPIGKKVNYYREKISHTNFYVSEKDLEQYRKDYVSVDIIDDKYCRCSYYFEHFDTVDGYVFNGKEWYPAEDTWDGWIFIDDKEIKCDTRSSKEVEYDTRSYMESITRF